MIETTRAQPFSMNLVVVQKRGSLLILRGEWSFPSEWNLLAENSRNSNYQRSKEKRAHYGKGKDPLKSKYFCEELANSDGCRDDTKSKSHGVILIFSQYF